MTVAMLDRWKLLGTSPLSAGGEWAQANDRQGSHRTNERLLWKLPVKYGKIHEGGILESSV